METPEKKSRLVRFSAENYKKIVYAEVVFDEKDNLVMITGDNAQGKSCFIEGIRTAIDGARHSTGKPIRNGQRKAILEVDIENVPIDGEIDDLHIKRVFGVGAGLYVTRSDKSKTLGNNTPMAILDSLRKKMIDPMSLFEIKTDKLFYEAVLPAVDLDVDLDELQSKKDKFFNDRTEVNRNVTRLKGHYQKLTVSEVLPVDLPDKEVSVLDLSTEIERRRKVNLDNDKLRQLINDKGNEGEKVIENIHRLNNELECAKIKLKTITNEYVALEAEYSNCRIENTDEISAQISTAEDTNRLIRHRESIKQAAVELAEEEKNSENLSREMRKIDSIKTNALIRAKFPVEGMSFDEGVVTFNGQPVIGGTSEGERLDICVEIACAGSHKLPFILVPSGSGLGSKLLEQMAKTSEKYGCTVIVEKLDESGDIGIVFENGEIIKDNRK